MQILNKSKKFLNKYRFSIYSNQHHSVREVINGKEYAYDHNLQNYEPVIQAFLQKRWTKKEEIPSQIYTIETLKSIQNSLQQQELFPLTRLLDQSRLLKMYDHDEFSTPYIISIFCEEYFKPLMDEYVSKVLLNGRVTPLKEIQDYNQVKQQVLNLYHVFFYGDQLSALEREIEFKYLAIKQKKFFRYQAQQRGADKCAWTYSQQRRIESMVNWRSKDADLFDDQRPIYNPLNINEKLPLIQLMMKLNQDNLVRKISFELFEKRRFLKSRKKTDWMITYLFTRTMLYTNSIEFLRALDVPPDFHIEHSIVNIHVWLIIDRLKKINTTEAKYAYKTLDSYFRKYTSSEIGKIHLKKKNDFIKDVDSYMKVSRNYLDYHFNRNPRTIQNNYIKLDALVWSIVFFEKVPRYSEQVYIMAEYLKANYDYMQTLPFEKFEDADIQFDVYKISLDFKEKIMAANPPLEEEEFLGQFYSDDKKKKYYYSYDEHESFEMPQDKNVFFDKSIVDTRLEKLNSSFEYQFKKFYNLKTYDHFNQLESQIESNKELEKYIWQVPEEIDINDVRKSFIQKKQQQQI